MANPLIPEGFVFVSGRSSLTAVLLLRSAKKLGYAGQVATTSHGYIVRLEIAQDALPDRFPVEDGSDSGSTEGDSNTEPAAGDGNTEPADGDFNPSEHTVAEVQEYLETATDEERTRVLEAEKSDKNRVSLVGEKGDN